MAARHVNEDEDYQLKQWQVLNAAKEEGFHQVSDFGPVETRFGEPLMSVAGPYSKRRIATR